MNPIQRLKTHLLKLREWDEERDEALNQEVAEYIRVSYKAAEKLGSLATDPGIAPETMFEQVYEDMPSHLQKQLAEFMEEDAENDDHMSGGSA